MEPPSCKDEEEKGKLLMNPTIKFTENSTKEISNEVNVKPNSNEPWVG